jgi:hypothetical protein
LGQAHGICRGIIRFHNKHWFQNRLDSNSCPAVSAQWLMLTGCGVEKMGKASTSRLLFGIVSLPKLC